jgi:quercetin dioxygenase-like cupin family protein
MFGKKSENGYSKALDGIQVKTIVYGRETLMVEFVLEKDAALPEHAHVQEQTGYLVKGKMKLFIGNSSRVLSPGDSWTIPSNVRHRAQIIEDSLAVEVFSPCREDYLKYVNGEDIVE